VSAQIVSLDQNAVRAEIETQIAQIATTGRVAAHDHKLLVAIESIADDKLKAELFHKCLDAVGANNATFRAEIESRIRINELLAGSAIKIKERQTDLFNSRPLVIFAWVFPVVVGFAAIKWLQSYVFATFIVIILYGVLIALYFAQSDGLEKVWKALTGNRGGL
jgi:hypothetical protein